MTELPAERGMHWFGTAALPLWLDRGLDRKKGGFFEALDHRTLENTADFRRLRVTARQIYVFAAAVRLGLPDAREGLDHGLSFLLGPARHPDWGFANKFNLEGNATDSSRDLYDLAFVCFALAHAYNILRDRTLLDEATTLLTDIRTHMSHPAQGFHEALPPRAPRRQNPHMHLLEACLAWCSLTSEPLFRQQAEDLLQLFSARLYQKGTTPGTGSLPENYHDDWAPETTEGAWVTEPGHHLEWVWLLHEAARLNLTQSPQAQHMAGSLYRFAKAHGFDQVTGVPFGEVSQQGHVLQTKMRLWVCTEWTKAETVGTGSARDTHIETAWSMTERFLHSAPLGLWHETWDPEADAFMPGPAPASSLYHIVMAIEAMVADQTNPITA